VPIIAVVVRLRPEADSPVALVKPCRAAPVQTAYSLDRDSLRAALDRFLTKAVGETAGEVEEQSRQAA